MPDKLTIHFVAENGNTVSKFGIDEKGQITFQNDASAGLTVDFGAQSPICQGNQPVQSVAVDAGKSKMHQVCDGVGGNSYKYTATVAGANPEDPIVIIEKSTITNPVYNHKLTDLGIGFLAGVVVATIYVMLARSRSRNPT